MAATPKIIAVDHEALRAAASRLREAAQGLPEKASRNLSTSATSHRFGNATVATTFAEIAVNLQAAIAGLTHADNAMAEQIEQTSADLSEQDRLAARRVVGEG